MNVWWSDNETLISTFLTAYILGLSMQVVLRAGVFSLASAGTWGIGAYAAAYLTTRDHSWVEAVVVAVLLSAVVSAMLALLFNRLSGLYLGMATIAFDLLVVSAAYTWDSVTGGELGLYGIPRDVSATVILGIAVLATIVVTLLQSWAGDRGVDVVRADPTLASTIGVNVRLFRLRVMVLSGALGGLAGALSPMVFGVIAPGDAGFPLVILGLTIVVLGGSRSWVGVVIGAVLVTWLPQWLSFVAEWRDLVYGALIVLMVLFEPEGITGIVRRIRRWLSGRGGTTTTQASGDGAPAPRAEESA
ncbi:MAG: branched-chain amino acid ABC transporter permease [Actinomycetia bacterium]|nr:branched-chain amino acid ABC transporter permease [Actinomycetes bacterium]